MNKQYDQDTRVKIKNARPKFFLAATLIFIIFIGLNTKLFTSLGIFNFERIPNVQLLNLDINALNRKLAGTEEGVHFLEGMVFSVLFGNPTTGMVVGFLKESFDIGMHLKTGTLNNNAVADGFMDLTFWILGALAGFYALIPIHAFFIENNINNFRELVSSLRKKEE